MPLHRRSIRFCPFPPHTNERHVFLRWHGGRRNCHSCQSVDIDSDGCPNTSTEPDKSTPLVHASLKILWCYSWSCCLRVNEVISYWTGISWEILYLLRDACSDYYFSGLRMLFVLAFCRTLLGSQSEPISRPLWDCGGRNPSRPRTWFYSMNGSAPVRSLSLSFVGASPRSAPFRGRRSIDSEFRSRTAIRIN